MQREKRYYIKEVASCQQCPFFEDESEKCLKTDIVIDFFDFIHSECPLPTTRSNYGNEKRLFVKVKPGNQV